MFFTSLNTVSKVIYKVNYSDCDEFYIGKTVGRLSTRINEHEKDENSSLYKHAFLTVTDHIIDYCKPEILARDANAFRLCVQERKPQNPGLLCS